MKTEITITEARRIALTSQGFTNLSRDGSANAAQISKVIARLGLLQIDSVNVLVRAHYVPLFSRLGAYDPSVLHDLIAAQPMHYFEYWGHEASLLPVETHPLLRWRMAEALQGKGVWRPLQAYAHEKRADAEALLSRIGEEGPLAASDLKNTKAAKGMWAWSDVKHAMEWLFWSGQIAATHRRSNFERVYDLPERVLPKHVLNIPIPAETDAIRGLLELSARALGIATADDLRDYYRIPSSKVLLPLQQLAEEGTLRPVRVRGWRQEAYLHREAKAGRNIAGGALLSPFDPLVWNRQRTERLFDFRYRLEIYTPAHKREHGYYVLPFLLDGALVARTDLKADRPTGTLIVQQLHIEPGAPPHTGERLMDELRLMALWLGLEKIVVTQQAKSAGSSLAAGTYAVEQ